MLFLLIFIAVPIIEIAAFIKIGDLIGLWPTIACIILTAIVGTVVLRRQGLSVLRNAQESLHENRVPLEPVIHGAFLLVAGALLLTPGFFTDTLGFVLLVPPARTAIAHLLWRRLKDRVHVHHSQGERERRARDPAADSGPVIEGEAVEVENDHHPDEGRRTASPASRDEGSSRWKR